MQKLHHALGERQTERRHNDEVVYIERTTAPSPMMRVVQIIGARAPLHITAVGKVFLSQDAPTSCIAYAQRTGLPGFTPNTLTDSDRLVQELERVRTQGYAVDNEEAEKGFSCIGCGDLQRRRPHHRRPVGIGAVRSHENRLGAERARDSGRDSRAIGHKN